MVFSKNKCNEKKRAHIGGIGLRILKALFAIFLLTVGSLLAKSYFTKGLDPALALDAAVETPESQAPSVVGYVVENADLSVAREYIGLVEPIQTVFLMTQVPGQIDAVHFKDGSMVKRGDLLFTIDDKQYQANVSLRKADLSKAEAALSRASKYYERLNAADKRSVSEMDLDTATSDVQQCKATIEQTKAALTIAQIDLGHTKVTAPISGWIGKAEATRGNYVVPSGVPLATIVQLDPIRVSFAVTDKDYLEHIEAFRTLKDSVYETTIKLADGAEYPLKSELDFEDKVMDEKTGTIKMHIRFKNEDSILTPGSMVDVRTKPAKNRVSPVIPQEAVVNDASGDIVYVIDDAGIAHVREVSLGAEIGTTREVISGLSAGERIVRSGTQSVRPEMPVKPNYPSELAEDRSPADLVKESGYDLPAVGSPGSDGVESVKGTN
ncbi:MAG: efflux RND transporter periplasmic adaptor subunit [Synergistaceae bacterium]|jgi:RND family efflux transporter MFP subunit|nr:efflux RND transporter periplasmic adaptor subunit [Synergistaceae bacterium]